MTFKTRATIEDLYREPGKAELVNGEIVRMPPAGEWPGYAGGEILASLWTHAKRAGAGRAVGDNQAFCVSLPHRGSFSPSVAFVASPRKLTMKFHEGAPNFAAEVRNEGDYGARVEAARAQKRSDYFTAGTLVVWDVDLLSKDVVRVYRSSDPANPKIYQRGEIAEAEPAVPGWTMPVDDLFEPDDH